MPLLVGEAIVLRTFDCLESSRIVRLVPMPGMYKSRCASASIVDRITVRLCRSGPECKMRRSRERWLIAAGASHHQAFLYGKPPCVTSQCTTRQSWTRRALSCCMPRCSRSERLAMS